MAATPLHEWRLALRESGLPAPTRHVALALSVYMDDQGWRAYPGATRLATDTGLHVSTVREKLAQLVDTGWLEVIHRGGRLANPRTANEYRIRTPLAVGDPSPETTHRPDRADPSPLATVPLAVGDPIYPLNYPLPRAARLPVEFPLTIELRAWASERVAGLDLEHHHERFCNYWHAKGGSGATKVDWVATWRNWMLKEHKDRPPLRVVRDADRPHHLPPSSVETCPVCDSSLLACKCGR